MKIPYKQTMQVEHVASRRAKRRLDRDSSESKLLPEASSRFANLARRSFHKISSSNDRVVAYSYCGSWWMKLVKLVNEVSKWSWRRLSALIFLILAADAVVYFKTHTFQNGLSSRSARRQTRDAGTEGRSSFPPSEFTFRHALGSLFRFLSRFSFLKFLFWVTLFWTFSKISILFIKICLCFHLILIWFPLNSTRVPVAGGRAFELQELLQISRRNLKEHTLRVDACKCNRSLDNRLKCVAAEGCELQDDKVNSSLFTAPRPDKKQSIGTIDKSLEDKNFENWYPTVYLTVQDGNRSRRGWSKCGDFNNV